jgi:hypothetical protein
LLNMFIPGAPECPDDATDVVDVEGRPGDFAPSLRSPTT